MALNAHTDAPQRPHHISVSPRFQVLLLDELTTYLDYEDSLNVLRCVQGIVSAGDGVTALWVTHRWAASVCV